MRGFLVLGLLVLSGCDRAGVDACEGRIRATLVAPSTYDRVSVTVTPGPNDMAGADELTVYVSYDAENSFGAPLRNTEICKFPVRDGRVEI